MGTRTRNKPKTLLIVAGDYGIVQHVRQALGSDAYKLHYAFSHQDALHSVGNGQYDAALVDAAMFDRHTGEVTLEAIAVTNERLPLIIYAPGNQHDERLSVLAQVVLGALDKQAVLDGIATVLPPLNGNTNTLPTMEGLINGDNAQHADEIQTLFALSRSLTEVLDLNEVLNRVVEAARRLTNAEEGMILLPDDNEPERLMLRAKVGIDVETASNFRIKTQDTLAGAVFKSGEPVLRGAQGPQKVKTEYFVNALLYVPIKLKGKPIGVLGVNNKTRHDVFEPRQQELLLNLASFAAIAIENARIHEESLQYARELEVLVEASHVVNSSLSLDRALPNICEQLARVLNVDHTAIYEWDHVNQTLNLLSSFHCTIWRLGQGPLTDLGRTTGLLAAVQNRRSFWITDNGHNTVQGLEARQLRQSGATAMMAHPIYSGERALGVLQLYYIDLPDMPPKAESLQRLERLALEAFAAMTSKLGDAPARNVFRLAEEINRVSGSDWCELALVNEKQQTLAVQLRIGQGVWLDGIRPAIDLIKYPDLLDVLKSQKTVNVHMDSEGLPAGISALLTAAHSRVILGITMIQRGQTQGLVVFADAEHVDLFSKREMDLGRAIVGQAATALDNAKLVRDLEQSLQELKDTQDRLVQTARLSAMGELAAAVAHQINNPLTTIMVDAEMMLADEPEESPNYKSMLAISRASKRAAGVARRLLAISRPNDPEAPTEPIDVVDTIRGVLSLIKSHIERNRIRITVDLPAEELKPVYAVPGQLDDIWLNLLMNAHDALMGQENGAIGVKILTETDDDYIAVVIWDNGPGIPEHIKMQIFRPFFTTKPVGEGTGLGLHICRQVVERVGGHISVESTPGQGTSFLVRLPVMGGEL